MKLILILSLVFLTGCFPSRSRNVFGNGEEIVTKEVIPVDYSNRYKDLGKFQLEQYRRFWFGDMTYADTSLTFTNHTQYTLTYTFYIQFEMNSWNERYGHNNYDNRNDERFSGHFKYTGTVANVKPGETINFGKISERIFNLNDGTIVIRPDTNTLRRD